MREVEVTVETELVRVRIMSLTPREIVEWHCHTEVTDDVTCLTGAILVRMKKPDEETRLTPGKRCQIKAGRIHQLENLEGRDASYLLVQGVGKYDFNPMPG